MKSCLIRSAATAFLAALSLFTTTPAWSEATKPTPVVLVADIGDDIDDTWALGLLLKSPELDLKLVVGDYGKAQYRACLFAKILQSTGRTNVPVGVGLDIEPRGGGGQSEWVGDYKLENYPGPVIKDGVQAIVDTIMNSKEPVTLIAIGPAPNVAAALQREPKIAQRARLVGMYGSLRVGYDGSKTPAAEWNVKCDPKSCQAVFTAPWDMTITPLDTCGLISLSGEQYRKVRDSKDPVAATVIENYRIWSKKSEKAEKESSVLFDTVAIYLAMRTDFCTMETLGIKVNDDGFTVIDPQAKKIKAATSWKDLNAYREFLVNRLTTPVKP